MKTYKDVLSGKTYLIVELIPVYQKKKTFYVAKIPAAYFLDLYTVKPTIYDDKQHAALASTFSGYEEYFGYLLDKVGQIPERDDSERNLDLDRVKDIKDFLDKKDYALFPNAIIASCDLMNDKIDIAKGTEIKELIDRGDIQLPYLFESDDVSILYIPYEKDSILVLDGQHRLAGLERAELIDKENDYELLVAFMLKIDRSTRAELFYTINYNQKPVNRSLLYQLMGEFSREMDRITFMHEAVKILNEVEKSPLFQRVKMLGRIPEGTATEIREKMTISQAFLIDSLERTISIEKMGSKIYPPIFLYYYNNDKKRVEIIKFILKYFQAISRINSNEWMNPADYIICNSMGIGALIRVMHFVFIRMFVNVDDFNYDPDKIEEVTVKTLTDKLDGIQNIDFSKEAYGGASSAGRLNQLVKDIVSKVSYLGAMNYDEFIQEYKDNYVAPYRNWLNENVKELKKL